MEPSTSPNVRSRKFCILMDFNVLVLEIVSLRSQWPVCHCGHKGHRVVLWQFITSWYICKIAIFEDSLLNLSNKGNYMTKKTVQIVNQQKLKRMALPTKTNSAFSVAIVQRSLFGKDHSIKNIKNNIGFNYGCKKVFPYVRSLKFQDTVNPSSNESKTIGLKKHPMKLLIIEHIST